MTTPFLTDDEAAALREAVTHPTDRTSFPSLEEVRALLDERDALRTQIAALTASPAPPTGEQERRVPEWGMETPADVCDHPCPEYLAGENCRCVSKPWEQANATDAHEP